jgi:hypothetical protein
LAFPPALWSEFKQLYQLGEVQSLEELLKIPKLVKKYRKLPSFSSLQSRCHKEGWDKQEAVKASELLNRENVLAALAARISPEKIVAKIESQLDAKKSVIVPSNVEGEPGMVDFTDDNTAIDKAITQTAKIAGLYAPQQIETVTKDKLRAFGRSAGEIILSFVPGEKRDACATALTALMAKLDEQV